MSPASQNEDDDQDDDALVQVTATAQHGASPLRLDAVTRQAQVRLTWTDAAGPHDNIVAQRATLGSAANVDVVIADPTVSRLHAELDPRDDGLWIHDLGSRNGTFVDQLLVKEGRVGDGARVRFGSTLVTMQRVVDPLTVALWPQTSFGPLLGQSNTMRELFVRLARIAATESTVLIHGETGTGKELVARAIHEASARATMPFVVVDCAALPENLLESELFGHARGAFTGALVARDGAIESADGGTVFLDEIGELPLAMQPKLLRVLETRMVRRLGEPDHRKVDVRVVAATHRDLREMVNQGAFREDLYFRLAVIPLSIPPLRQRPGDIQPLLAHFLSLCGLADTPPDAKLLAEIVQRPWLGNVRELRNFVERWVALGPQEALALTPTGRQGSKPAESDSVRAPPTLSLDAPFKDVREQWVDQLERDYLTGMMARHSRSVPKVAQAAGLHATYVRKLLAKHGL